MTTRKEVIETTIAVLMDSMPEFDYQNNDQCARYFNMWSRRLKILGNRFNQDLQKRFIIVSAAIEDYSRILMQLKSFRSKIWKYHVNYLVMTMKKPRPSRQRRRADIPYGRAPFRLNTD